MLVKSDAEMGTGPVAPDMVTTHVQVVALAWNGRPSPGTCGPLTVTSTDHRGVFTCTPSPWLVRAGRWMVPVSTVSLW